MALARTKEDARVFPPGGPRALLFGLSVLVSVTALAPACDSMKASPQLNGGPFVSITDAGSSGGAGGASAAGGAAGQGPTGGSTGEAGGAAGSSSTPAAPGGAPGIGGQGGVGGARAAG